MDFLSNRILFHQGRVSSCTLLWAPSKRHNLIMFKICSLMDRNPNLIQISSSSTDAPTGKFLNKKKNEDTHGPKTKQCIHGTKNNALQAFINIMPMQPGVGSSQGQDFYLSQESCLLFVSSHIQQLPTWTKREFMIWHCTCPTGFIIPSGIPQVCILGAVLFCMYFKYKLAFLWTHFSNLWLYLLKKKKKKRFVTIFESLKNLADNRNWFFSEPSYP